MSSKSPAAGPSQPGQSPPADSVGDQIDHNIAAVLELDKREDEKVSRSQRFVEKISRFVGRTLFLGCTISFVAIWILVNVLAHQLGLPQFDPPPFFWLGGIVGLAALLTTTVVLIEQNRLLQFEEKRSHLELQVNLLTEQKTTKIIQLIEELRRDLPNVRDRLDPETEVLQHPTNPQQVLATMEHRQEAEERTKHTR
ncbi:MAG: DUF1003 domain-containing protein [Burkholderiales bacterium]|nr:DUF1003 domain-containing protein [Burkholderiales bacterium]